MKTTNVDNYINFTSVDFYTLTDLGPSTHLTSRVISSDLLIDKNKDHHLID